MSFASHQSFHIRDGWLRKGLLGVKEDPELFSKQYPEDVLGVGRAMVKAIRFWLPATGLVEKEFFTVDGKRLEKYNLTKFAEKILEKDKYFEQEVTLWLLHYKLVTSPNYATTWYWFFNHFGLRQFTSEMFLSHLQRYVLSIKKNVATTSLEKDFRCFLRTYTSTVEKNQKDSIEDSFDSPFALLNLLHFMPRTNSYRVESPSKERLHSLLVLYALVSMQEEGLFNISLRDALHNPLSPGRVFCLESENLYEHIAWLGEEYPKWIKLGETSGAELHNILITKDANQWDIFEEIFLTELSKV